MFWFVFIKARFIIIGASYFLCFCSQASTSNTQRMSRIIHEIPKIPIEGSFDWDFVYYPYIFRVVLNTLWYRKFVRLWKTAP